MELYNAMKARNRKIAQASTGELTAVLFTDKPGSVHDE
jgi:hypothetical protein